jgi:CheY-like chemotaxis protein
MPHAQSSAERLNFNAVKLARGTETILLVEDKDALRELTSSLLGDHGYTVLEAGRAELVLRLRTENESIV